MASPDYVVFYLARGSDVDAKLKMQRFRNSYLASPAGQVHRLIVIYKGFADTAQLLEAEAIFGGIAADAVYTDDDGFDLAAYFAALARTPCDRAAFLNTSSEIVSAHWLAKLAANLDRPDVGIVGASGSYESPVQPGMADIVFPNPHLRSNAFLIRRRTMLCAGPNGPLVDKHAAHLFEHGPDGFTRRIARRDGRPLIVGANGRGYEVPHWPISDTFRQGNQDNLLVSDNQTHRYKVAPIVEKKMLFALAWGDGTPASSLSPDAIDPAPVIVGTQR